MNGKKFDIRKQKIMKALCSFVAQSDILCAAQTVQEALTFYAELKLNKSKHESSASNIVEYRGAQAEAISQ